VHHEDETVDDKPLVSIEYCTVCNFRSRAAWLAQELLAAHEGEIAGVTLVPGRGGVLIVRSTGGGLLEIRTKALSGPASSRTRSGKLGLPPSSGMSNQLDITLTTVPREPAVTRSEPPTLGWMLRYVQRCKKDKPSDYCLILQVHPEADAAMVDAAYCTWPSYNRPTYDQGQGKLG
jgi:selenoprotein W-related protein